MKTLYRLLSSAEARVMIIHSNNYHFVRLFEIQVAKATNGQKSRLFAYECACLKSLNAALKRYGPSSFKRNFIIVKLRKIQETKVVKRNMDITGMSGNIFIDSTFH